MKISKPNVINTALMDALGIEWRAGDVVGVTLRMRGRQHPTVTVHRQLLDERPIREMTQRFVLTRVETVQVSDEPLPLTTPSEAQS
jgi:hypothetical protein